MTLIRIAYNCRHETNRKITCVHRRFRRAVPIVLLERTTRQTRALKTSSHISKRKTEGRLTATAQGSTANCSWMCQKRFR